MDMGAAVVLPMLRRCNSRGNFSILNVTEHTSKETDPPEVDPSSKILRTITECLEQNCTLNVKRNSFGDFAGAQPEIRTSFGPGTWRRLLRGDEGSCDIIHNLRAAPRGGDGTRRDGNQTR